MDERPSKRARTKAQTTYRDAIPLSNEYDIVYAREETTSLRSEPAPHVPQTDTDSWATTISWSPPDDPSFALDPDGGWYDEAVESNVMDDVPSKVSTKTGKTRSTVSVSNNRILRDGTILTDPKPEETPPRHLDERTSADISGRNDALVWPRRL